MLASLTAAVWMAMDVGERVLFFLPKLELDFQDVHDFDGVISPDVEKGNEDFKKTFLYFGNEIFRYYEGYWDFVEVLEIS